MKNEQLGLIEKRFADVMEVRRDELKRYVPISKL
jgi:hypothetical protein